MPTAAAKEIIRESVERKEAKELEALKQADKSNARPPGWALSPRMVETFILGSGDKPVGGAVIRPKYIGDRHLIQVAIATLASDRALLLVGEPGTAKSWLSEHLAAAVSGSTELLLQGTAGTTEDQVKYSWNYALLIAEGPTERALVKSPVLRAMENGSLARFEEVTRTASEVQDALISILSEKSIAIPELGRTVQARRGFNIIATANTRDRGVNEMSSALKRRFNFVTVPVVNDLDLEMKIVQQRTQELQSEFEVKATVPPDFVQTLVTVFQELRAGLTKDGKTKIKTPSSVLSTAELISVVFNGALLSSHFGTGKVTSDEFARSVVGAVSKENVQDRAVLAEYCENVAKIRKDKTWKEFYESARKILKG
jgi:MoxR-like ATPase